MAAFISMFLIISTHFQSVKSESGKQLLILAPPIYGNEYYADKFLEVIPFYINYISNITGKDDVLLIADKDTMPYYKGKVDDDKLILGYIDDPWVRDVSTPIPSKNIQFTYIGSGNKTVSRFTQGVFDDFIYELGIKPVKSPLYLDGGNLVNNNGDKVITTRKFLADNNLTETEGVEEIKTLLGVDYVSVLTPDEPTLGHSDGMAAYVCNNTIYMQKQEEPEHTMYKDELVKGCPHCVIIEVEGYLDNNIYKGGYASSCGVYVNCVVTQNYIYMPIFMHEKDKEAVKKFQNNPCGKTVVPIDVRPVCEMGGSLRCLSWQTQGGYAVELKKKAAERKNSDMKLISMKWLLVIFQIVVVYHNM